MGLPIDGQALAEQMTDLANWAMEATAAMERAEAARAFQFIVAAAIVFFVTTVICSWRAGRATTGAERTLWLREVAWQVLVAAIAIALGSLQIVSIEVAAIGCGIGLVTRLLWTRQRAAVRFAAIEQ